MNLIDAIKSGRPIRRRMPHEAMRNLNSWICSKYMLELFSRGDLRPWGASDFLADDWEIQEPTVTITKSQFWAAVRLNAMWREEWAKNSFSILARELGLE